MIPAQPSHSKLQHGQQRMSGDVRIPGAGAGHQNRPWMQNEQTMERGQQPLPGPGLPSQSFDPAFVISHSGRVGSSAHQSAAASAFFAKKHQHQHLGNGHQFAGNGHPLPLGRPRHNDDSEDEKAGRQETVCNFSTILAKCPPPPPASLIKKINDNAKDNGSSVGHSVGKVKVILRVANSGVIDEKKSSFFKMDKKKKQVTLLAPDNHREHAETPEEGAGPEQKRCLDVSAPKMFAFDGLYTDEDGQNELSGSALCDILQAVVNGTDGTLFCFGHANLGKSFTMIGSDESSRTVGVIPTAVSWLYKAIKERRDKGDKGAGQGARFSVRVSAAEIRSSQGQEEMRDLLSGQEGEQGPAIRGSSRVTGTSVQNLCEIRAASAEKAGYYLDCALSNRSVDAQGRDSHFLFTLHVYQHSVSSEAQPHTSPVLLGGRSRLHLIDFGCCERTKTLGGSITIAGLGNVILGILNGQRHLPFKESKVTQLLREVLGSVSCQVALLAHISPEPSHHSETLHTIQLASRIHRMRRKKMRVGGSSGGGSGSGGSSDENKRLGRPHDSGSSGRSSSDMTTSTDPSSSEQSCDTVIYTGPRDDEGTDCESPPVFLPSLNSGDQRAVMSRVLKGSSAELPPARYRSLDRKSPRSPLSPMIHSARSPVSSQHSTPVKTLAGLGKPPSNTGSLPRNPRGKMPLFGKVAGYRQPPAGPGTPEHGPGHNRLSVSGSGISGRSRLSGSGSGHLTPVNSGGEIWVDSAPVCDRDLVPGAGGLLPQQYDTNAIYGYMDDHKKAMIQQWVEGQATNLHSSAQPPSHLTGRDSLAWLQAHSEARAAEAASMAPGYKCLTQFKMAESSTSEASTEDQEQERVYVNVHRSHEVGDEEMMTVPGDDLGDPYCGPGPEMKTGERLGDNDDRGEIPPDHNLQIAPSSSAGDSQDQTCQHESENKCREDGETGGKSFVSAKQAENVSGCNFDDRSVASRSSTASSRKSDVGTNTDPGHPPLRNLRNQDPFGSSRKLTLRRTSGEPGQEVRSLDELYSHCEALVETLSQASEELRARDTGPHPSDRDESEIYDRVSEGSEASVEVSDMGCQASEEDIALCLGVCLESLLAASALSSEQHLRGILSQPGPGQQNSANTSIPAANGPGLCPLSSLPERCDMKPRRFNAAADAKEASRDQGLLADPDVDMMADFDKVCEEVSGSADHEEFFNKKFDQLEKLHELYKSVSSISAASQSRLELNKNRTFEENRNLMPGQRSASFSLTGLMLGDLDNLSLPSTVSDDLNSLCSEPAWVTSSLKTGQATSGLDINRNSTSCTNSALDLANLHLGVLSGPGSALSLCQLMAGARGAHTQVRENKTKFPSQLSVEPEREVSQQDRSDSPILEGIDSDLAKYAELKDLERAYKPKNNQYCDKKTDKLSSLLPASHSLRHPDGASNPDLESSPPLKSPLCPAATLPRRSPGTGRSSSGSDAEMETAAQKLRPATRTSPGQKVNLNEACADLRQDDVIKSGTETILSGAGKLPPPPDQVHVMLKSDEDDDKASEKNIIKEHKEKTPKIPRFSRLFGNVKKISKSPTQISKSAAEEKPRSKASKRQTKTSQISLKDSGQLKTEKLISDKPTKSKYRFFEKREKCFPKSPVNVTKNVKGTLSSEQLCEKPSKATKPKNSPKVEKKKDKVKTKSQGVSAVMNCLPSPYSFPSKVKTKRQGASETSGSGYDSGIESGGAIRAGIASSSLVKIRGKGADTMILTGPVMASPGQGRRVSRSHCKSSGYESIGGESESVESYTGAVTSDKNSDGVQILNYDSDTVTRMDRHWRFEEIKRLKKKQEHLKDELYSAKSRINSDPDRWSYELHTEASGLDHNDPNFVEAFEKETVILDKRVQACKSHVVFSTSFMNRKSSEDRKRLGAEYNRSQGCTADCEPYGQPEPDLASTTSSQSTGQL